MATPGLYDHKSSASNFSSNPAYSGTGSFASNTFYLNKPNASGLHNCLVLFISCPYSAGRTITITDNKSNTWPSLASSISVNNGTSMSACFILPNCAAATQNLTIVFDAQLNNVTFNLMEWYNIATATPLDVSHTATTSATATIAAGSMTPGTSGDLIIHYGYSTASPGTGTTNITGITAMSSPAFTIDCADVMLGKFVQYYVQPSAGAINATATLTGSTDSFNTIAIALKSASAGTAPPTTIYIVHEFHIWAQRYIPMPCPSSGNLIYLATAYYYIPTSNVQWLVTGVTSSPSNTWTEVTQTYEGFYMPQCWYAPNASTSSTMTISVLSASGTGLNGANYGMQWVIYDVAHAATSPLSAQKQGYYSYQLNANATVDVPTINHNPLYTQELVFFTSAVAFGCLIGAYGASGQIWDTVSYTNVNPNDLMDNVDAYAHYYTSSAGAIQFGVIDFNAVSIQYNSEFLNAITIGFIDAAATLIPQGDVINVVQSTFATNTSTVTSFGCQFAQNTTTGNTVLAVIGCYDGATLVAVDSVTISPGAAGVAGFQKIVAMPGSANNYTSLEAWCSIGITGGTLPTVTANFRASVTSAVVFLYEISGLVGGIAAATLQELLDGNPASLLHAANTNLATAPITTVFNNDILFAAFTSSNNVSGGQAGWTGQQDSTNTGALVQYIIESTTVTNLQSTATVSPSSPYGTIILALTGVPPVPGTWDDSFSTWNNANIAWNSFLADVPTVVGTWNNPNSLWSDANTLWDSDEGGVWDSCGNAVTVWDDPSTTWNQAGPSTGATTLNASWLAHPSSVLTFIDQVVRNIAFLFNPKSVLTLNDQRVMNAAYAINPKSVLTLGDQVVRDCTLLINPAVTLILVAQIQGGGPTYLDVTWSSSPKATLTMLNQVLADVIWSANPKAVLTLADVIARNSTVLINPKATLTLQTQQIQRAQVVINPKVTLTLRGQIAGQAPTQIYIFCDHFGVSRVISSE